MAKKKSQEDPPMPRKGTKSYKTAQLLKAKKWQCRPCGEKITGSSQYAGGGGIQRLKGGRYGWEIETHGNQQGHTGPMRLCGKCKTKTTHDRFTGNFIVEPTNQAQLSEKAKQRIRETLGPNDVIFNQPINKEVCYEHKSPSIRWPSGDQPHDDDISDDDIKSTFQLYPDESWNRKKDLSGCRPCVFNQGKKGRVPPFKEGWPKNIPPQGPHSVEGCKGCFWYDTAEYRKNNSEDELSYSMNKILEQIMSELQDSYDDKSIEIKKEYESAIFDIDKEYLDAIKKFDLDRKKWSEQFLNRIIWTSLVFILPTGLISIYFNHIAPFIVGLMATLLTHHYKEIGK